MTDDRAINFQKAYGINAFIKEQAFRNLYGGSDVWSFNPHREVDEIADEDSDEVPEGLGNIVFGDDALWGDC